MPAQTFASQICEINAICPAWLCFRTLFEFGTLSQWQRQWQKQRQLSSIECGVAVAPKLLKVLQQLCSLWGFVWAQPEQGEQAGAPKAAKGTDGAHPLRTNLCHACINIFIVTSRKMCAKAGGNGVPAVLARKTFPTACQRFIMVIYFLPSQLHPQWVRVCGPGSKLIYLFIF